MGNIESTFIKEATYRQHLPKREHEDSITGGSLYNLMVLLNPKANQPEAAVLPLRVNETEPRDIGGRVLFLVMLDMDLKPTFPTTFFMEDGLVVNISSAVGIINVETGESYTSSEAYLRSYGNGLSEHIPELTTMKDIPQLITA